MPYTPTTWSNGDTITAEKLNKLEKGIAETYPLIVRVIEHSDKVELDRTFQEIYDAMDNDRLVYLAQQVSSEDGGSSGGGELVDKGGATKVSVQFGPNLSSYEGIEMYMVYYVNDYTHQVSINHSSFYADSANGYPYLNKIDPGEAGGPVNEC